MVGHDNLLSSKMLCSKMAHCSSVIAFILAACYPEDFLAQPIYASWLVALVTMVTLSHKKFGRGEALMANYEQVKHV